MKWSTVLLVCFFTLSECKTINQETLRYRRDIPPPPDHTDVIGMARYIIHNADWASMATISVLPAIQGYPFSSIQSMADGTWTNSTGIPYFYMTRNDFSSDDILKDNQATILVSLKQTKYCESENLDAIDPRCARVMLSGIIKKIDERMPEHKFAKTALLERHPAIANYPKDHAWFVAKLKIAQILMFNWFGGAKNIPVSDYLAYKYTKLDTTNRPPLQIDMGLY